MKRESSPQNKPQKSVELFSDLMLMKFKPKHIHKLPQQLPSHSRTPSEESNIPRSSRSPPQITFLQLASKEAVVIGNASQLDMISLDGLTHNFVDTFYYWSLSLSKPIQAVKLSMKKQLMMVLAGSTLLLYTYTTLKKERGEPRQVYCIQLRSQVRFMQFAASDQIALFYDTRFQMYSLNDANIPTKRLDRAYGVPASMKLFAVPQAIYHTVNIFFEESHPGKATFGLWCVGVHVLSETTKLTTPYKIYDIMCGLSKLLILENYSKDIVFLNLGKEILVARAGYIIDSVTINLQDEGSYLKFLPRQQVLVHIERSSMDLYSFTIDATAIPNRIRLDPLDSLEIAAHRHKARLLSLLPVMQRNYALFYEETPTRLPTRGEVLYSFVLSYSVQVGRKVQQILGGGSPAELGQEELQAKCNVLRKLGLSDRDIFLEVWRRSSRSTLRDYQLLLATRDYKTIKNQMEEKLKKQSIPFKEVFKIEESCRAILLPQVHGQQCTEELLRDFLTCSLFMRKLSLWRQLQVMAAREDRGLINIQDYFQLKNMELKEFVLERVGLLLSNHNILPEIRLILHHFRFVYRFIYRDLLEKIVSLAKQQLLRVLEVLPDLLPVEGGEGVWGVITEEEWENGLHLQQLVNISNRNAVEEFIDGLWFKRNWLTTHDLIPKGKAEIEEVNRNRNSISIFYYFIGLVLEREKDESFLKQMYSYLEGHYPLLPEHLRGNIMLYWKLYNYYNLHSEAGHCPSFSVENFLELRDYNLFKYFFDLQKMRKNSLLKEIKPIYEQVLGGQGVAMFNQSLFNYFRSEISEVSNLKYLLNRINNEKKQFHAQHEPMYQVLIKAMQFKLKIGSPSDIPVEEVLIYIENIPLSPHNSAALEELDAIRRVGEESETFRRMKLNMSIRQIIDNYETVIEKVVEYQIKKNGILSCQSLPVLLQRTYRLLAEVQSLKEKIYGKDFNELAFFIFLTKLLQQENKISTAGDILNDQYLNNYYFIDIKIVESLVLYMYRWRLAHYPSYPNSSNYLAQLVTLLPADNHMREFIELEVTFALLLSTPSTPLIYPIVTEAPCPRIVDLEDILHNIQDVHLAGIQIQKVAEAMKRMEELSQGLSELTKYSQLNKQAVYNEHIEEQAVIKVFINCLITRNRIKQALPLVRKCILSAEKPEVLTLLILIYYLLPELNEQSRNILVKIASYLYFFPIKLFAVLESLINRRFTGLESIDYLHNELLEAQKESNFNEDNPLFNIYFIHLSQQRQQSSKRRLVENTLIKLKRTKIDFQHEYIFNLLFIILCHEPLGIAVFLRHVHPLKWRSIRSFLSYLVQEEIFDELLTLQACRRSFFLLLRSYKERCDIYRLVSQYSEASLIEEFSIKTYEDLNDFQRILEKNVKAFEQKKIQMTGRSRSFSLKKNSLPDKEASIKQSIKNPQTIKEKEPNQYVFSDSDDDYQHHDQKQAEFKSAKKKQPKIQFDPKAERRNFIRKDRKDNIEARKANPTNNRIISKPSLEESAENSTNIKKFYSLTIIPQREDITSSDNNLLSPTKIPRSPLKQQSGDSQLGVEPSITLTLKHKRSFADQINKQKSKDVKRLESPIGVEEEDSDDEQLFLSNLSEHSQQGKASSQEEFQENASIILKKIYRTFDDKQEKEPYNLKILHTEKNKNDQGFTELIKQVVRKAYLKHEPSFEIAFKLIIQIGKSYPQIEINMQSAEIFQKIAKFQTKYGLQLPIEKILPYEGLFLKSKTPQELFSFIKQGIIEICDEENIFKISKLISIGFKKNTIQQEIIVLYLAKLITQLNLTFEYAQLGQGLDRIRGIVNKMQVKTLVDKTEGLVDQCTHFDLRRKLVQIFIETIRMKGNGKDAKELTSKLK